MEYLNEGRTRWGEEAQRKTMRRFTQFAIISLVLGALAAAQETPAPATPAVPPAPVVKARPATAPVAMAPPAAAKPAKPSSYLGVDIRDVTHDRMAALKLKDARGVEITMVDGDAPAGKAGLKEHDVILSFNGRNLQGSEDLRKLIRDTPPGHTVELGISRDGKPMNVKTQLADRRRVVVVAPRVEVSRIRIPRIAIPIITTLSRQDGVLVENLTPQLGEVFGVKNGEGVLIRSVEKGSPGETAGLRAGDVIVRVGNQPVAGTPDWNRLMREQKPGPVQLGIMRDKRQQTLSLTVPEHSGEQADALPGMEEFRIDMEDLDLQQLQPEIELSMREAQRKVQRELERSQREWERSTERAQREADRAQEQARRAQEQARRAQEQAQREVERAQRAQEQAQRAQEQAQREAERDQEEAPPESPANPPAPPAPPPSPPR
jgi:membrane-associated protease RseP (regulator of RpoE activity)